jgi:Aldehyde dehydrogenase family
MEEDNGPGQVHPAAKARRLNRNSRRAARFPGHFLHGQPNLDWFSVRPVLALVKPFNSMPGSFAYTIRQPFGVTAGIIPWNAPALFLSPRWRRPLRPVIQW